MSQNIEMNYFNGNEYEVLYPSTLSNLITLSVEAGGGNLDDKIRGNVSIFSGSAYGSGTRFSLTIPVSNGKILFISTDRSGGEKLLFICINPVTWPWLAYFSSRDGSFSERGQSCTWSASSVYFSFDNPIIGTYYYSCIYTK